MRITTTTALAAALLCASAGANNETLERALLRTPSPAPAKQGWFRWDNGLFIERGQLALLLIDLFSGHPPAIDIFTLGTLLIRPITSGILFIVLANVLVGAANPRLGSSGR